MQKKTKNNFLVLILQRDHNCKFILGTCLNNEEGRRGSLLWVFGHVNSRWCTLYRENKNIKVKHTIIFWITEIAKSATSNKWEALVDKEDSFSSYILFTFRCWVQRKHYKNQCIRFWLFKSLTRHWNYLYPIPRIQIYYYPSQFLIPHLS